MKEIWKDIPGYDGYYQASNLGRIKRVERFVIREKKCGNIHKMKVPEKIRKSTIHSSGYCRISLCKNGKCKSYYIHNLIAITFIDKKKVGFDVDHINKNRVDNRLCNLRYLSIKENRGIIGNKHGKKKAYE